MEQKYGPFEFAFDNGRGVVAPYLQLLNLVDDSGKHIQTIRELAVEPGARAHVVAMMREVNWRPHLVGIVAASSIAGLEAELWSAVDRRSWVTPQIAAVLSLVDENFASQAKIRLANGCLAEFREYGHPSDPAELTVFPKMAASLQALLGQTIEADDRDSGDQIALGWRTRFLELRSAG